jgi:hypothetical protein
MFHVMILSGADVHGDVGRGGTGLAVGPPTRTRNPVGAAGGVQFWAKVVVGETATAAAHKSPPPSSADAKNQPMQMVE